MSTMKLYLFCFTFWLSLASTRACSTVAEGSESVVDCSDVSDVSEIVAYMNELLLANSLVHDRFRILKNPNIDNLLDGLLGNIQFTTVEISSCSSLSQVGDFLGDSSTTLMSLYFNKNLYAEVPALNAVNLKTVDVSTSNPDGLYVMKSSFATMRNIETASFWSAVIQPLAFYDLKSLRKLYLPFQSANFQNLTVGTLLFDSAALELVDFPHSVFANIEYGSMEGFPVDSELRLYADWNMTKEAFFNLLYGGGRLYFHGRTGCGCEIAWIRLGPFLDQTFIACARPGGDVLLQNVPEEEFVNCEVN